MEEENKEKSVNQFTTFFQHYVRYQYRALPKEVAAALGAIFGRQDPIGWNRWLVFDDGLFWKLLRDWMILFATAIRVVVGTAVLLIGPPAIVVLALARALFIPLRGMYLAAKVSWSYWSVNRARKRQSSKSSG